VSVVCNVQISNSVNNISLAIDCFMMVMGNRLWFLAGSKSEPFVLLIKHSSEITPTLLFKLDLVIFWLRELGD